MNRRISPLERTFDGLQPLIGRRSAEWIISNLPSRKPQLWEAPLRAALQRAGRVLRARFGADWQSPPSLACLTHSGLIMELHRQNEIDLALIQYGVYEISGTRFVQAVLEPGMTFVDVGANSGYYSLIAARSVAVEGHVCAIEPAVGPFAKLCRNVQLNQLHNVATIQAAVARMSGRSILYPSADDRNDGLASLKQGPGRASRGLEVPTLTLTEIVDSLPGKRVDLVKIDVEGGEADVFGGGEAVLAGPHGPALLFESWDVASIAELLTGMGYEVRRVHFSLANGLEFLPIREPLEGRFPAYEPPSYVALKAAAGGSRFETLSSRSRHSIRAFLRVLAKLA